MSARTREQAARARAALAYGDKKQAEAAKALDMSVSTWARVEAGKRPLAAGEIEKLAELTGVPAGFLRDGFDAPAEVTISDLAQRIGSMELLFRGAIEQLRDERLAIYREFISRTEHISEVVTQNNDLLERVIQSPVLDPAEAIEQELAEAARQADRPTDSTESGGHVQGG